MKERVPISSPTALLSITLVILLYVTSTSTAFSARSSRPRRSSTNTGSEGPKSASSRRTSRRVPRSESKPSSPRRSRTSSSPKKIFDPKVVTSSQISNETAPPFSLLMTTGTSSLRLRSSAACVDSTESSSKSSDSKKTELKTAQPVEHAHFDYVSLDSLFPNLQFSEAFVTDSNFRESIRRAMRRDVFDSTPAYSNLSPKVAEFMLDDDSSLQGSWNCIPHNNNNDNGDNCGSTSSLRMTQLTKVLRDRLGDNAPNGDEFMMTFGRLCGHNPSTHWIDIIGVKDRPVSHSWHQDTGRSVSICDEEDGTSRSCYTVMLGFPCEDDYDGTGVFSHVIKLAEEHFAPNGHTGNEPVLFEGEIDNDYIIRPKFERQREILRYRDVDILHSAPDAVYRSSVMRFM